MKKRVILLLTAIVQMQFAIAQSAEVNLPSFSEEGLGSLISSSLLQTIIFILAGLAGAMALSFLVANLRLAFNENHSDDSYSSRYPLPSDPVHGIPSPRTILSGFTPQLAVVDHEEAEEEDPRGESKGQRGE